MLSLTYLVAGLLVYVHRVSGILNCSLRVGFEIFEASHWYMYVAALNECSSKTCSIVFVCLTRNGEMVTCTCRLACTLLICILWIL